MNSAPSHSPEKKDSDFFTEHTQVSTTGSFPLINALLAKATPFVVMTYILCLGTIPQRMSVIQNE